MVAREKLISMETGKFFGRKSKENRGKSWEWGGGGGNEGIEGNLYIIYRCMGSI